MSFLTSFAEEVYPTDRLAETIRPGGFSIELARSLMWLSQAAYETTADGQDSRQGRKLERLLGGWGLACRARLSGGGTEGFVAESDAALVVAFAGTDPVVAANWITDFDIRTGTGGVHRGFYEAARAIWPDLGAALAGTVKPILLTGHSLGGALAVASAWRLVHGGEQGEESGALDESRIAGVVAFGAPRVGDAEFAAAFGARALARRTIRLAYGADIIPNLPPAAPGPLGFRHVGLSLRCRHAAKFSDAMPPRDEPDVVLALPKPEEIFQIASGENLAAFRTAWARILDHGVPRSPAGGVSSLLSDRLPYFLRDHLQDCYLEALGWSFARPANDRVSIRADDADAFAHQSQTRLARDAGGFSLLLRRLLSGG